MISLKENILILVEQPLLPAPNVVVL